MSKASIIGAYNTKFGSFVVRDKETREITDPGASLYDLIIEAGQGAIADAGLEAKDIDAVYFGACSPSMFVNQEHLAPLGVMISKDLRFKPMTRCEAACASSSVALYDALYTVEAGRYRHVLVIGVEKMNELNTKGVTHALACSSFWPTEGGKGMTFPGLFAEYAKGYQKHYNISDEDRMRMFASVSALCYKNALDNPLAHFGKGSIPDKLGLITADAILALEDKKNPMIAEPLRLHDCSLVTDGAAAVVISADSSIPTGAKAVQIAGIGHAQEIMEETARPQMYMLEAGKHAVNRAFAEAKITIKDVDLAEVHDCFTINQLLCTEALGLAKDGQSGYDYINGRFTRDDDCPVNLSGGLKAKGHPVGATGASMHALIYKQITGEPIGAVPAKGKPETGVILNVGGSAATNCVTVLRRKS